MNLTIVHYGGTRKTVELEDITPQGWVQVRYPNGGGCYRFSLVHGRIEVKRGAEPEWSLEPDDLERCKAIATERKIKPRKQARCRPTAEAKGETAEQAGGAF